MIILIHIYGIILWYIYIFFFINRSTLISMLIYIFAEINIKYSCSIPTYFNIYYILFRFRFSDWDLQLQLLWVGSDYNLHSWYLVLALLAWWNRCNSFTYIYSNEYVGVCKFSCNYRSFDITFVLVFELVHIFSIWINSLINK